MRMGMVGGAVLAGLLGWLVSCASEPPPPPPPPPVARPERPAPPPPPVPIVSEPSHAPLIGTEWRLESMFGERRGLAAPRDGSVIRIVEREGDLFLEGTSGPHRFAADAATEREPENPEDRSREAGRLSLASVRITPAPGTRTEGYAQTLVRNLSLTQGYRIEGTARDESRLTIYGGYGAEEIILIEAVVDPAPRDAASAPAGRDP